MFTCILKKCWSWCFVINVYFSDFLELISSSKFLMPSTLFPICFLSQSTQRGVSGSQSPLPTHSWRSEWNIESWDFFFNNSFNWGICFCKMVGLIVCIYLSWSRVGNFESSLTLSLLCEPVFNNCRILEPARLFSKLSQNNETTLGWFCRVLNIDMIIWTVWGVLSVIFYLHSRNLPRDVPL